MGHLEFAVLVLSAILITIQYTVLITTAQPNYVHHLCSGENYNSNSIFQSNLNRLLMSISSSNNIVIKNGYYNTTVGRNPDSVFGSFQCSGFATLENCQNCVHKATQEIMQSDRCPNFKQAIIWYNECLLRYSDESYFSIMEDAPEFYAGIGNSVDNGDMFDSISSGLLHSLIDEVSKNSSSENNSTLYANGEINYRSSQNVYGVVQCTADISPSDCNTCLRVAISNFGKCCFRRSGGRVIVPSCYFRYETYRFNDSKVNSPSSSVSPSPPQSSINTTNKNGKKSPNVAIIVVVVSLVTATLSTITVLWCFCIQKRKVKKGNEDTIILNSAALQIDFNTIKHVTNNFSDNNKLGEGGFGSVYKGTLENGQEIAVKRLSGYSSHGGEEFKNEVMLVAELRHQNLVRLLGFSLDKEEKLLIYEFMANASLDRFLFDPVKCTMLNWERRYNIILGIAQGLLYLHEDSQRRIIHRDLKASNILLDVDMNPKISDFGTARMCVSLSTQANTSKIVGTYGYMAPEYVKHGYFSEKSDVFSFGVLVLEILSGKKNQSFDESETGVSQDLLSYAWRFWKNETPLEFLDPSLRQCCVISEVMISIGIGLSCVQPYTTDRPTMASIVAMLKRNCFTLPQPSAPAYFITDQTSLKLAPWSAIDASTNVLHPR